jgi:hypothetical protein
VLGVKKAETFLDEWESIVTNVRKFKSKTLYDKFISSRGSATVPTKNVLATPPKSEKLSAADIESARKLAAANARNFPSNEIVATWKTTSHTTLAEVFLEFNNSGGTAIWSWKPPYVVGTLNGWTTEFKVDDPEFDAFLDSLTHAFPRDPTSDDPTKKLVKTFEPQPGRFIHMDQHVLYGYLRIPVDDIESKEEETAWINDQVNSLVGQLRDLLSDARFEEAMKQCSFKKDYIEKMFDRKKGLNLPDFMDSCRINIQQVSHLTDHVVKKEADIIMSHLYNNRQIEMKYTVAASDDEEESEEEETAAEEKKDGDEDNDAAMSGDTEKGETE